MPPCLPPSISNSCLCKFMHRKLLVRLMFLPAETARPRSKAQLFGSLVSKRRFWMAAMSDEFKDGPQQCRSKIDGFSCMEVVVGLITLDWMICGKYLLLSLKTSWRSHHARVLVWHQRVKTTQCSPLMVIFKVQLPIVRLRQAYAAFVFRAGFLVAFGGRDSPVRGFNDVWVFDLSTSSWRVQVPSLRSS
jgi:hypothetical protein